MKKKMVLLMFLSTVCSLALPGLAEETNSFHVSGMVDSPVKMKKFLKIKEKTGALEESQTSAIRRSLKLFRDTQKSNGSWGTDSERELATPLVLLSFLRHGETGYSDEFGETVRKAKQWVMQSSPTETASRIVTAVALSDYQALSSSNERSQGKTNVVDRIRALAKVVSKDDETIWMDFAAFNRISEDIKQPNWTSRHSATVRKYRKNTYDKAPKTVDGYLSVYLTCLARLSEGGKPWFEFRRQFMPKLLAEQKSDGSYPTKVGENSFVATALATLCLEVRGQYWPYRTNAHPK